MNLTRVTRAIVHEAVYGGVIDSPFTVPDIVEHYDLDWGNFPNGANRAEQLVRNELNKHVEMDVLRRGERVGAWRTYWLV